MNRVLRPSDRAAIVGVVNPASHSAGTVSSGWVSMAKFERIMAVIQTGVLGTAATVAAKLEQAQDSSGAGAKDVSGKAITTIVKASGDNKQAIINMAGEDIDANDGFTHVRLSMTVAEAASVASAVILGFDARYAPGSDDDLASVDEIV